jgi:para-aminobenzoate synthetase component 1
MTTPKDLAAPCNNTPVCVFENRLTSWRLALHQLQGRIAVHRPADLPAAWAAIEQARQQGYWVALLLDYELGEWLDASSARPDKDTTSDTPRLTALIFARASEHSDEPPAKPDLPPAADTAVTPDNPDTALRTTPTISQAAHQQAVDTIRDGIARGDYYQVNYTLALTLDCPPHKTPDEIYRQLLDQHPVAYAACIQDESRWILSLSPELFVARHGDRLVTRPMKGTAPRDPDPVRDQALANELLHSAKNRAENIMIVDLLRNDLGRIATPGSVKVSKLCQLEGYPSVWTMTSTIQAEAPQATLADVIQALFPCGSVTGAPKIAAMQAIRQLEQRKRGIYCGSVGWLAPNGDFSLNVAIRTLEIREDQAQFGVGGGIVADSDAQEEWQECLWKARILHA